MSFDFEKKKKNYVRTTNLHSFKDAECLLLYMPSFVSTLLNKQDSLPSSSDIQTPERRLRETPFHPEGSRQDYRSQWMSVQWIKPMRCGIHFWFAERIRQFITTEIINHQKCARFVDAEWWWYHVIPCDTMSYHVIPSNQKTCHVLQLKKIRRSWQVRRKESPRPNGPLGSAVEPLENRELLGWRS